LDSKTFSSVYSDYFSELCSFFARRNIPSRFVEDLAQETFLNFYETYQPKRGKSERSWLYLLAHQHISLYFTFLSTMFKK
ncbi:MAG: sigma factor, partial [Nanoarchaeota archaeon]|nr:sigma factor [Nanoarchaeota archaeon]